MVFLLVGHFATIQLRADKSSESGEQRALPKATLVKSVLLSVPFFYGLTEFEPVL